MLLTTGQKILVCSIFATIAILQLDLASKARDLTIYLGNGKCLWSPPNYEPTITDFFSTLMVGYPGGSKRIVFTQIEAMTGQAFNDEWPTVLNRPNRPFMKGNYPHHEGTWGFGDRINQVIMLMRNPMHAIIEYHDVLHDISYATDPVTAYNNSKNLYLARPDLDSWRAWRDLRLPAEIHWYGWFIDYWMEGGLLRDLPSHRLATSELWTKMWITPGPYYESGQGYLDIVGNATVTEEYDSHCVNDVPNGSCEPVLVISAEKVLEETTGPIEMLKVAQVLNSKQGIDLITNEALPCIWQELMVNKKGLRTMQDRDGDENIYKFKLTYITEMISELTRLKIKYSGPEWSSKQTAQDLVSILTGYITDLNAAIDFGDYE